MRSILRVTALVILVLMFGAVFTQAQSSDLQVVTSTSIIRDVAQNVAGDLVEVESLIPQGADVHSYLPTPSEVFAITEADVIFVNGANLEEGLLELIEENAEVDITVVSNGVEILPVGGEHHHDEDEDEGEEEDHEEALGILGVDDLECEHHHDEEEGEEEEAEEEGDEHDHGVCDPHVWMDPANVIIWTNNIADTLSVADPDNADAYRANADAYIEELSTLIAEINAQVEMLPSEARVLVTNHEFLGYFAHAYEFEVVGVVLPGGSTFAEPNPQDLLALVEEIEEENVQAIFIETSSPSDLAETVAEEVGYEVQVVTLYSGTLSNDDEPASTYLDYMRFNVDAIVSALNVE